jgi:hypothetical protein
MVTRSQMRVWFGYYAIAYALVLLISCKIIPSWGQWYSYSLSPFSTAFRAQTDAFLRGELALSHNPSDLALDLCWSEGGVHQVWGLGVPLWRLPFEALARLFGRRAFPDRLELGLFMALVAYVVWSTWVMPVFGRHSAQTEAMGLAEVTRNHNSISWTQLVVPSGAVMLSLLFAPFINLLKSPMWQYEEALVYVYLFGIMLICGIIVLSRNPQWARFMVLCALAGLGCLVRGARHALWGVMVKAAQFNDGSAQPT